jgi:hypothetical protein
LAARHDERDGAELMRRDERWWRKVGAGLNGMANLQEEVNGSRSENSEQGRRDRQVVEMGEKSGGRI